LGGVDPDIAEAAALAHDLGHPPFGHIAEEELDRLLVQDDIKDGFNGNAQSFRIVSRLWVASLISSWSQSHPGNAERRTQIPVATMCWRRAVGEVGLL